MRKVSFLPTRLIFSLHQFDVDDSCSDDVMEAEIKTKRENVLGTEKYPILTFMHFEDLYLLTVCRDKFV